MEQRQLSRGSLSTRGRKRRHQIGASFSFIMDDSFITIEACRRHACSFQKRDNWLVWVYWSPEWMDPFLLVLKVLHDAKTNTDIHIDVRSIPCCEEHCEDYIHCCAWNEQKPSPNLHPLFPFPSPLPIQHCSEKPIHSFFWNRSGSESFSSKG